MRTITELASLPTNSDGSKQERVGITKLFNAIQAGRFVEHIDDSITLDNVTYKPNAKAALTFVLANKFDGMADMLRLFENDYAMPMQQEAAIIAAKAGTKKPTAKPLEGHVMTSAQWLQSCIYKLPELPEPDYIGAISSIVDLKESMTKAQLWEGIQKAISLVNVKVYTINDCTSEQQDKYYDLLNKERAINEAAHALRVYLEDIQPCPKTDNMLRGKYPVLTGTMPLFKQLISEEKWELIGAPIASTDGEHMTFTIKVI